jgi:hypothetical protein
MAEIEGGKKKRVVKKSASAHKKAPLKRKTVKRVGIKRAVKSTRVHAVHRKTATARRAPAQHKSVAVAAKRVLLATRALQSAVAHHKPHAALARKPGRVAKKRTAKKLH